MTDGRRGNRPAPRPSAARRRASPDDLRASAQRIRDHALVAPEGLRRELTDQASQLEFEADQIEAVRKRGRSGPDENGASGHRG